MMHVHIENSYDLWEPDQLAYRCFHNLPLADVTLTALRTHLRGQLIAVGTDGVRAQVSEGARQLRRVAEHIAELRTRA